ncbi:hypothetical protein MG290_06410 [Flavobacterium sp. CBA20B-1]|uniref:hypothetical protein n=1 Tax=unclassified Flavobacterium TaxID=196869 RepID=UPI00222586B5|nr:MULTISPECIES: hypothetical protein [unclassified Flavobacterium]WCM43288.1 hypothetical protein MG290_06410 [Flavobacterium sp. CBA20B-1]
MIIKTYRSNIIFILSVILINACNSSIDTKEYPIVYSSKNTQFNMFFYNGNFPIDAKLILNKDKSYFSETCVLNEKGIWKVKDDSIFLFCNERTFKDKNLYKIDSLKQVVICRDTPEIWVIKNNRIKQVGSNALLFE